MITYGSLFSGYGGLDMGVQAALGAGRLAWMSDIEPGPKAILAHHHPATPNLGDITAIDWADVEPVDVIAGGSPCQDLSLAGQRAGMRPGTRSGLWESMAHAINQLHPRLVVWENVLGAVNAGAFSLMESDPGRVGGDTNQPVLRALGRVLGDLTNLGYDARWETVRASDIGAPHRRERLFVIAYPHSWVSRRARSTLRRRLQPAARGNSEGPLLATPNARDYKGVPSAGYATKNLARDVTLLPTPTARDYKDTQVRREPHRPNDTDTLSRALTMFGDYAPAIERWEQTLGRPAPEPTVRAKSGKPQLSARFVEWMMGLPEGHVTAPAIGISRTRQLKALGNGVVPQQAEYAIRLLLGKEG